MALSMGLNVFVLTGAGISAESGLGTFRDTSGIWTRYDLSEVATPQGFARDPAKVRAFYNARRENLAGATPNAAHLALAKLQAGLTAKAGRLFLCTQNVDDLHEQAGSTPVIHMHGELRVTRCHHCHTVWPDAGPLSADTACPACRIVGATRPHVVWFGESPLFLDAIEDALEGSDLFVAIGTSGAVYPAAGLVDQARRLGLRTCEINLEPSDNARAFDERRYGPASVVLPVWVDELLREL
jgi:NAD-dependent deacetylase